MAEAAPLDSRVWVAGHLHRNHFARLQRWQRKARGVGYLDEGYAASQLWKTDLEHNGGEELAARAASLVRQIEPL